MPGTQQEHVFGCRLPLPSKTELLFEIRQDSIVLPTFDDEECGEEPKISKVKIRETKNTTFRDVASL